MSSRSTDDRFNSYDEEERIHKRPPLDLIVNWILVIGVLAVSYSMFERDWYFYKNELLFFQYVQDGSTPEQMDSAFMAKGVERNMVYKDKSQNEFFWDQWLPKIPLYLLCLGVPFFIGIWRLRKKEYRRLNTVYYIGFVVFLGITGYFFLGQFEIL